MSAVIGFGSNQPADLLVNAASVTRFLADVSGSFTSDNGELGLSDQAANGLCLILLAVEETITEAVKQL
jgi:hypothetical protein